MMLKGFLDIYEENGKNRLINILYEEKKKIAKELGIIFITFIKMILILN